MAEQFPDEGRMPAIHPAPRSPQYVGAAELGEDAMPLKVARVVTLDAMDSSGAILIDGGTPGCQ
eukprot:715563-Lingulodinium_polyedra.AAC.1